jgi:hypothetical protein
MDFQKTTALVYNFMLSYTVDETIYVVAQIFSFMGIDQLLSMLTVSFSPLAG